MHIINTLLIMKKALLSILCLTAGLGLSAQNAHTYQNPTGNEFPILAWVSVQEHTPERYAELREAGFNLSLDLGQRALPEIMDILKAMKGSGVKLITSGESLSAEELGKLKKEKDFAGYNFGDEPSSKRYPEIAQKIARIRAADDEHLLYANLFPTYASAEQLGVESYDEYAERFVNELGTGFISYDNYPICRDNNSRESLRGDYFENFEKILATSKAHDIPLWAFTLSVGHLVYPTPTRTHIRLQLFCDLAYGAQGLQYFTYWKPGPGPDVIWHDAPIDEGNKRTAVWDIAKETNEEIQRLSHVFLGAKVVDVAHIGAIIPRGTHELATLPAPFSKIETRGGDGAVVSHLVNGENHYLMIVNRDLYCRQEITVHRADYVNRILSSGKAVKASEYLDSLSVDPGDYLLFQWKEQE